MYFRLEKISLQLEGLGVTHLSYYPVMLRRLANNKDIQPLKTFVDVVEPLNEYQRWPDFKEERGYTLKSYSPYTRVMDAAQPESVKARKFTELVKSIDADASVIKLDLLKAQLYVWKRNHRLLLPLINKSPVLEEVKELSMILSELAFVGIEAIDYIGSNTKPSDTWIKSSQKTIEDASVSAGQVKIAISGAIEMLVENAIEITPQ
jgi:hexosaminidase